MDIGLFIIILVGVILLIVLLVASHINFHTFRFLKKENELIGSHPYHSELLEDIKNQYNFLKDRTENDINIQTFIEEYIADFKHDKSLLKMVQDIKLIQTLGSISILIGVLGTFVGLVISLGNLDQAQLDESITSLLGGINTAFYTSICGIILSIFINLMTRIWNVEHLLLQIMLKVENALILDNRKSVDLKLVDSMQDVKTSVEKMTAAFISVENFSKGFEKATENLNNFNEMFSHNTQTLSSIFGNMEEFTKKFNERMDALNNKFDSLINFLEKQEEVQAYSVDNMKQISSSLGHFITEQNAIQMDNRDAIFAITNSFDQTKDEMKHYLSVNLEKLHDAFGAMTDFYDDTLEKQNQLIRTQEVMETKNTALIESVQSATHTMKEILETNSFEHIAEITSQFNGNITEMHQQFENLIHYFTNIDEVQQEYKELYRNVVAYIEKQADSQEQQQVLLDTYGNRLSEQNSEMINLFTRTQVYHQSFEENSSLLTMEMKRVIEHSEQIFADSNERMKEQLSNLHGALNEFVSLSNDKMKDLIYKLDDSLGENLQKSLRTFETYVKTTNQIIDKKFQAVVENSNIQNELSSYSIQTLQQSILSLDTNLKEFTTEIKKKMPHLVN